MSDISSVYSQKTRPLGLIEAYSSYRHNLKQYFAVVFSGLYSSISYDSPLTKEQLYDSLTTLIVENPSLALTIHNETSETEPHTFKLLEKFDLNKIIHYGPAIPPEIKDNEVIDVQTLKKFAIPVEELESNSKITSMIQQRVSQQFPNVDEIPPWRLYITPVCLSKNKYGTFVSFGFHHALGDGTSGRIMLTKLFDILNQEHSKITNTTTITKTDPKASIINIPATCNIRPTLESVLKLPESFFHLIKIILQVKGYTSSPNAWTGNPIVDSFSPNAVSPETYVSKTKLLVISKEKMVTLLNLSRNHKVSVTSSISAIAAISLHKTLLELDPNYSSSKYDSLLCGVPRNLRSIIPDDKVQADDMGVFVCGMNIPVSISQIDSNENTVDAVWAVSQSVKTFIDGEVAKGDKNTDTGMLRYATPLHHYFTVKPGHPHSSSLEISSIVAGPVPSAPTSEKPFNLSHLSFVQTASLLGAPINMSLISYKGGDLGVGVTWSECTVSSDIALQHCETFQKLLDEVLLKA